MENIKTQIYNLVYNSIENTKVSKGFVLDRVKVATPEEIKELALKELDLIEYFVRLEREDSTYWKDKKSRLCFIIWIQNK